MSRPGGRLVRAPGVVDEEPEADPWPVVRRRVTELVSGPGPLLVVSDFDGTLAGISLDPMAARIEPLARSALRRLARVAADRPARVRVVLLSGRTALDLATRVRVGGVRYLGDHGTQGGNLPRRVRAEHLPVIVDPRLAAFVEPARSIGQAVATALGNPAWLFVEDKGPSVAFHYRAAADVAAAGRLVGAAVDARLQVDDGGLQRFDGRRIVELRAAGAAGKGAAVARLLDAERFGAALVLGDDRSDAQGFAAVAAARSSGRLAAGLALGVHGAHETPPEVVAKSDLILADPAAAARVLSLTATILERERGRAQPTRRALARRSPRPG